MSKITRRDFLRIAGAASAAGVLGHAPLAHAAKHMGSGSARVVIVGGGFGGATCAKYLRRLDPGIAVTLVEPSTKFITCPFSNMVLGGLRNMDSITHSFDALKKKHGVNVMHDTVTAIDAGARKVTLKSGKTLSYDRLVVSPGIDFKWDAVDGYSEKASQVMPHAWKAGPQTQLLKRQLDAVPNGGTIVMIAPPNPYRCPPGPYERVSMMAHVLKSKGHRNARIIVLDPKPSFSKQGLFMEGWQKHYPGMIEWQDPKMHGGIKGVDVATMTVKTDLADYKAAMVNVIPAQMAGKIARDAGLTNPSGWCPIDAANMRSTVDANVYVVGDASIAGEMPKSGFSANSQAKVAAMMIRGELAKSRTFPARYANTCWSLIATDDTVKVGASYAPKDGKIAAVSTFISKTGESAELRKQTQVENIGWYAGITTDIFG